MFADEKILVTGGAGFIGSHLVDKLVDEGARVIVADNLSTSDGSNINKNAEFLKIDIANDFLEDIVSDVSYVFHLAALPSVQYCIENPTECHMSNVLGTLRLLCACDKFSKNLKKFVYSSSCAVYGQHEAKKPLEETAFKRPETPYALQKLISEEYVKMYADLYGTQTISLRYANVYGTKRQGKKGDYANVMAAFSKQKTETGVLKITGDGEQSRDFIHVFDVVRANLLAAKSNISNGDAFNVSIGAGISINKLARYFNARISYVDPRPEEIRNSVLNNEKAAKLLGWKPQILLDKGMAIYFS